jgi:hypothetical protein
MSPSACARTILQLCVSLKRDLQVLWFINSPRIVFAARSFGSSLPFRPVTGYLEALGKVPGLRQQGSMPGDITFTLGSTIPVPKSSAHTDGQAWFISHLVWWRFCMLLRILEHITGSVIESAVLYHTANVVSEGWITMPQPIEPSLCRWQA